MNNVSDNGLIVAVDNADTNSHESYKSSERHLFKGRCIAIIKAKVSSAKITATAGSPYLKSGSVTIEID